jgi:hypothetical protein
MQTLATSAGDADRFIVSVGFVVSGEKLLGILYGAGATGSLDQNRIFGLWLQNKLVIDHAKAPIVAFGPDRQVISSLKPLTTTLRLFAEDGQTLMATADDVKLAPGRAYEITSRP